MYGWSNVFSRSFRKKCLEASGPLKCWLKHKLKHKNFDKKVLEFRQANLLPRLLDS